MDAGPGIEVVRTSSPVLAKPGQRVTYTVRLRNTGDTPRAGLTFTDDLSGLLDDAVFGPGLTATSGTVSFEAPEVSWTGDLAAGQAVTLTYDVTVNDPPAGDLRLSTTPTDGEGAGCGSRPGDPPCDDPDAPGLPLLYVLMTADHDRVVPGEVVTYTVTVGNVGTAAYPDASLTGQLSRVLDDATYNGDARATRGTVSYAAPRLVWTGDVPAGDTVTITYSVTVDASGTGDRVLDSAVQAAGGGTNCPAPALTSVPPPASLASAPGPVLPLAPEPEARAGTEPEARAEAGFTAEAGAMAGGGSATGAARLAGPVPGTNLGCAQRIPVEDTTSPQKQVLDAAPAAGADAVLAEVPAVESDAVLGADEAVGEVPAAEKGAPAGPVPSWKAGKHLDEEAGGSREPGVEEPFPAACHAGGSCARTAVPVLPFTGSRLDPLLAGLSLVFLGLLLRRHTRRGTP
ncbi:hypothetical protein [Streptosporangium sp. NPDC023615]|uniref:DUF7927 domain-containing protein n=1 Tax=Streptosporangium sp. NPDC023615 TaxID=3154794 RepID=UPI0034264A74